MLSTQAQSVFFLKKKLFRNYETVQGILTGTINMYTKVKSVFVTSNFGNGETILGKSRFHILWKFLIRVRVRIIPLKADGIELDPNTL